MLISLIHCEAIIENNWWPGWGVFVVPGPLLGTILRCRDTGDIYLVLTIEEWS